MLDDLERNHTQTGMRLDDVKSLLGKPTDSHSANQVVRPDPRDKIPWRYELPIGHCFDSRYLVIHFDHSNTVRDTSIFCN